MSQINKEEIKKLFTDYLISKHELDLLEILLAPDLSISYAVFVDCIDLTYEVQEVALEFFINIAPYLELLQLSAQNAQKHIYEISQDGKLSIKEKLAVRFCTVPDADDVEIRLPTCKHVNKFISFNGTVTKTFNARMLESVQKYTCGKCGMEFTVEIDFGTVDLLVRPTKCPKEDCMSDKFKLISSEKNFKSIIKDYQEIKVQEKLDIFSMGSVPKSILVILEDDLVDCCKPGDDVTINGIVIQRWNRLMNEMRCDIELVIHANYVKVNNDEKTQIHITKEKENQFKTFWSESVRRPMTARNVILASLCPQLYGMYIVRLAVSLVIAGGVSRKDASGTRVRGESHLLLVGDPGTGKSQFLKYANKIVPRSVLTTGIGSTSAGLTATASRDGGFWHLEAGALVLADGGICCVDEFNCMKEHDRASMLEAMEQQTISVAKAGIVCKLKTQCSVLAACNPKGAYDSSQPITVNIAISSPLLSRFDVVLLLLDSPNEEWDNLASTFLLQGKDLLRKERDTKIDESKWSLEKLRLYLNYIKTVEPQLTPDANIVIQKYYQLQRQLDDRNAARTTVRMLESVIRLSQAHAKLMLREQVLVMDAVVAITLVECSLNKTASFGNVNILHTSFPIDAEVEYRNQAELILTRLKLGDLLKKEFRFIDENFEPFCDNRNENNFMDEADSYQPISFDIISQMVGDVTSQRPRPTLTLKSQAQKTQPQKQRDELKSANNSVFKMPELPETNRTINLDDTKISRKRKIDTSVLLELSNEIEEEKNLKTSETERNLTEIETNVASKKLKSLAKFAYEPKPTEPPPPPQAQIRKISQSQKIFEINRITQQSSQSQRTQLNNLDLNNDDLEIDL